MIKKLQLKPTGFTLLELIVVLAVLAVLAAIIIPRYGHVQYTSKIKADAATAGGIIAAARIQETSTGKALEDIGDLNPAYLESSSLLPQSGNESFSLTKDEEDKYEVRWTAIASAVSEAYDGEYSLIEGAGSPEGEFYNNVSAQNGP